jgi:hypothetical protein
MAHLVNEVAAANREVSTADPRRSLDDGDLVSCAPRITTFSGSPASGAICVRVAVCASDGVSPRSTLSWYAVPVPATAPTLFRNCRLE